MFTPPKSPSLMSIPTNFRVPDHVQATHLQAEHLIPDDDIFVLAHRMDRDVPHHSHDFYELVLVYNQPVLNLIDGDSMYLLPSSLLLMNLQSAHAMKTLNPQAVIVNIGIRASLFDSGIFHDFYCDDSYVADFLRGKQHHPYLYYPFPRSSRLWALADNVLRAYTDADYHENFEVAGYVLLLLNELRAERGYSYQGIDAKSYAILKYIRDHYQTVSLTRIAKAFTFDASYLSRYIKRHFGLTATQLMTEAKLTAATDMLAKTERPIEDIASACGYQSTSHFYRVFKANLHMTPQNYRGLTRRPLTVNNDLH